MTKKTTWLAVGGTVAAVLTTGGVAAAATSSSSSTAGSTGHHHRHHERLALSHIEHGQFVSRDKAGRQVTHEVANGSVSAVSPTSISVKDGSGTTTTFVVDAQTRVRVKGQAKGAKSTIVAVKTGEQVFVLGDGTGPYTATFVAAR